MNMAIKWSSDNLYGLFFHTYYNNKYILCVWVCFYVSSYYFTWNRRTMKIRCASKLFYCYRFCGRNSNNNNRYSAKQVHLSIRVKRNVAQRVNGMSAGYRQIAGDNVKKSISIYVYAFAVNTCQRIYLNCVVGIFSTDLCCLLTVWLERDFWVL